MPTIPEVQHYWGPAQKLIEDIWKGVDIATATKEAQESYEALSRLGQ